MGDPQILTIALAAVPTMLAVLVGILINNSRLSDTNARIADLLGHMDARFGDMDHRFANVDHRFDGVDRRFDEMRDLWRSELYRVEQVIDARLKHLEERG
jgi:hypothetical protein